MNRIRIDLTKYPDAVKAAIREADLAAYTDLAGTVAAMLTQYQDLKEKASRLETLEFRIRMQANTVPK